MANTLGKKERLSSKNAISTLMSKGQWRSLRVLRYCFLQRSEDETPRIMVSVPKKNFKRAVKRNLLKRRIREAYRTSKSLLAEGPSYDILFFYADPEVRSYEEIRAEMETILKTLSSNAEKDS